MKFTERHFRTFSTMGFFAGLAKSNLVYTFLALVRFPILPYPLNTTVSTSQHLPPVLLFFSVHALTSLNPHSPVQQWESPSA